MPELNLPMLTNRLTPSNPDTSGEPETCLFLTLLPTEIRQKIYRLLFSRPVPIMPGPIHFREAIDHSEPHEVPEDLRYVGKTEYSYQWNITHSQLQKDDLQNNLPRYGGREGPKSNMTFITKPTREQRIQIQRKNTFVGPFLAGKAPVEALAVYWDENLQTNVTPLVFRRGEYPTQIVNAVQIDLPGIFGTQILRTCKTIHDEAIGFLYGNRFAFDFRPQSEHGYPWKQHLRRQAMNGFPFAGFDVTQSPIDDKIEVIPGVFLSAAEIFDRDFFKSRTSGEQYLIEPLAHFFNEIGPRNTQRITSVAFEGFLDKYRRIFPVNPLMVQGGDFGEVLDLGTRALKKLCPSLRELTIHAAGKKEHIDSRSVMAQWTFLPPVPFVRIQPWSFQRLDGIVGENSKRLKSLRSLHLTNDHFFELPSERLVSLWGRALKWEKFVEDRHMNRQKSEGLEDTVEVKDRSPVDLYLAERL